MGRAGRTALFLGFAAIQLSSVPSGLAVVAPCLKEGGCDFDEDESSILLQIGVGQKSQSLVNVQSDRRAACPAIGAQVYLTQLALDYLSTSVFPISLEGLALSMIQPISGNMSGLSYNVSNFKLEAFTAGSGSFQFVEGQGVDVNISSIGLSASLDYSLSVSLFGATVRKEGSVLVAISDVSLSMRLVVGSNATTGSPTISAQSVAASFALARVAFEDGAALDCLGSLWTDLIQPLAKAAAESTVVSAVESSLQLDLAELLGKALAASGLPLSNATGPHPYDLDIQVCGVDVAADHLALNLYAAVNTNTGEAHPGSPYSLSDTGFTPDMTHMLGLAANEWTIDGFVWLFRRSAGLLKSSGPASAARGGREGGEAEEHLKIAQQPGAMPDGRDMREVAEQQARSLAKDPKLKASVLPAGFEITDTKVRFFNRAVAVLASFSMDVEQLIASLFA